MLGCRRCRQVSTSRRMSGAYIFFIVLTATCAETNGNGKCRRHPRVLVPTNTNAAFHEFGATHPLLGEQVNAHADSGVRALANGLAQLVPADEDGVGLFEPPREHVPVDLEPGRRGDLRCSTTLVSKCHHRRCRVFQGWSLPAAPQHGAHVRSPRHGWPSPHWHGASATCSWRPRHRQWKPAGD